MKVYLKSVPLKSSPLRITRYLKVNDDGVHQIDGNVEFVHSQYSCILTSQVSIQFLFPTKLSIIVIILE